MNNHLIDKAIEKEWKDPYKIRTASEAHERAQRIERLEKQKRYDNI